MTNNELITELLKYDGWVFTPNASNIKIEYIVNGKFIKGTWVGVDESLSQTDMLYAYITDMNILHRIAVKVVSQLREMYSDDSHDTSFDFEHDMKVTEVKSSVVSAMFTIPNDKGEHLQLAEAIVNAIRYISSNKAG
jgi:hypothetical protein